MPYQKRTGIQLAVPFSERRLNNDGRFRTRWTAPYLLQAKLNGERCRAIVENGRCILVSSTDNMISSIPHINMAMRDMPEGEYDGELYTHGLTFSEIQSIISTVNTIHPEAEKLHYTIFDVVNSDYQMARAYYLYNTLELDSPFIHKVHGKIVRTMSEIMDEYDRLIAEGYEGFILRELSAHYLRRRSGLMMKFKPKETDDYLIHSVNEATSIDGVRLGMVGSFTCIDGEGTTFKVGAGKLTHLQRKDIWTAYMDEGFPKGTRLQIEYQTMSDAKKVPHFSRALKIFLPEGGVGNE